MINEDTNFANILKLRAQGNAADIYTFGRSEVFKEENGEYTADIQGNVVKFKLADNAEHYLYNALCALNVVAILGLDVAKAAGINWKTVCIPVAVALLIYSGLPVVSNPIIYIVLGAVVGMVRRSHSLIKKHGNE